MTSDDIVTHIFHLSHTYEHKHRGIGIFSKNKTNLIQKMEENTTQITNCRCYSDFSDRTKNNIILKLASGLADQVFRHWKTTIYLRNMILYRFRSVGVECIIINAALP